MSSVRTNSTCYRTFSGQQVSMSRPTLSLQGNEQYAINKEVHVQGWGNAFFTVRDIVNDYAWLSTRYNKRIKYQIHVSRCYFTRSCQSIITKVKSND